MKTGTTNPVRQQMINMMYLVLTALLALNVSADILKAFAVVNVGLGSTSDQYKDKNEGTMTQFRQLYAADRQKAEKYYTNAVQAGKLSGELFSYLQGLKENLAKESGGWTDKSRSTVVEDQDLEASSQLFLSKGVGMELRDRLLAYEAQMKELAGNSSSLKFAMATDTPPVDKDGTKKNWSEYYFEGVPSIAAITLLTKFQNDVRNAENEVTSYNLNQVNADVISVNAVRPIVQLDKQAVYAGDKLKARIMLGAYSTTQDPEIFVDGKKIPVKDGVGEYELTASGMGENSFKGRIMVRKPGSTELEPLEFNTTYQVFKGQATISAEKMNILYTKLENPLAISVPGYLPEQVTVKASGGGTLKKTGNTSYEFIPDGSQRSVTISAYVKEQDNSVKLMGTQAYRVRNVPKVHIIWGAQEGTVLSRGVIRVTGKINATLGPDFAYEGLNFKIRKFRFVHIPMNGQTPYIAEVSGSELKGEAKSRAESARPGDLIVISDVEAVDTHGIVQYIDGTTFKVR